MTEVTELTARLAGTIARYLHNELDFNLDDAREHGYGIAEEVEEALSEELEKAWQYDEVSK